MQHRVRRIRLALGVTVALSLLISFYWLLAITYYLAEVGWGAGEPDRRSLLIPDFELLALSFQYSMPILMLAYLVVWWGKKRALAVSALVYAALLLVVVLLSQLELVSHGGAIGLTLLILFPPSLLSAYLMKSALSSPPE